jgi:hypothetical protein
MPAFRSPVDLTKNELRNARVQNLASAPANPVTGQIYYNSADNNLYVWDNIAWVDLTVQGGGISYGTPSAVINAGDVAVAGVSANVLREDAQFAVSTAAASTVSGANAEGTSTALARADHNHALGAGVVTDVQVAAANKDGAAGTASLRTLGTGAAQAAAGNDTRFHSQNTDTGTSQTGFFLVGQQAGDVRIKKGGPGRLDARLGDDSGFAAVQTGELTVNGNFTVTGTTTTINSNTLSVGDNIIELNNDITTTAETVENAGLAVRRYTGANVRQDTQTLWDETLKRWTHVFPASAGTGTVTRVSALKYTETLGAVTGGTAVTVIHGLNTREVAVNVRDTGTNETVFADVVANSVDSVQITFGANASAGVYAVAVFG